MPRSIAVQPFVGQARAAPCHLCSRAAQQHRRHRAGRRRVADAHFPSCQQLHAILLLGAHQFNTRRDSLYSLFTGHSRALDKVPRARGHAAIHRAGHRYTRNAHVHRDDLAMGRSRHTADAGAAGGQVFEHRPGHTGVGLADPLRHNAVVGAKHQHGTAGEVGRGVAGQRGGSLDHRF